MTHLTVSLPVVLFGDAFVAALGAWGGWYLHSRKAPQVNTGIDVAKATVATAEKVVADVKQAASDAKPQ